MPELKNDRLLRALLRQSVDQTPVWMMRQAGRYLPEYKALRAQAGSFMSLCTHPEWACEVSLQPLRRFPLDAVILFSDILTIPNAMGLGLHFTENEGPRFQHPIRSAQAIQQLPIPDPEQELRYVVDAVRLIRTELQGQVPLIGFAGSPWTLATYMVEGGTCKQFSRIKGLMYEQPKQMHQLLGKLAQATSLYLNAQVKAGAQVLMLFDTWGGVLTTPCYREFSLRYMKQILADLVREYKGRPVPIIFYTKGSSPWLEDIANSGCDAIGLDWTLEIGQARRRVGDQVALQGNLDPCLLYASIERIEQGVAEILADFGQGNGHVFNLGHGIHKDIAPERAGAMIDAVHRLSKLYHPTVTNTV